MPNKGCSAANINNDKTKRVLLATAIVRVDCVLLSVVCCDGSTAPSLDFGVWVKIYNFLGMGGIPCIFFALFWAKLRSIIDDATIN